MSAQELITEHIDLWTSAIKAKNTQGRGSSKKRELYGVKKLRELILELAVRGKLVAQDSSDEPASVLLERIAEAKSQLIKENKIKKQKPLPKIPDEEKPFYRPNGWEWARLGEVTNYGSSDKVESKNAVSNTWVLELEDVEKETSKLLQKIRFCDREFKSSKNKFYEGDVIYGKLRPYLDKVIVADENGVCTTEMIPVRAHAALAPHHLRLIMKSPYFKEYANNSTHGMNLPRMGTDKARLAVIPIVPELEQHRIVAKVDELMALCDQLEQQTESSLDAHNLLVDTLLTTLTDARDANELSDNWARLMATDGLYAGNAGAISGGQSVFDTLITTDYAVEQLKQTILQLAVQGKLVPQDPSDEPASELLKRIAAEKEKLIQDKKIRKQKSLPPIMAEDKPFDLPEGWEWLRFGQVTISRLGKMLDKAKNKGTLLPYLRNTNVQWHRFELDDIKLMQIEDDEIEELLLRKGDLLICEGGHPGRCAIWKDESRQMFFQKALHRARPLGNVLSEYLQCCLTIDAATNSLDKYFTGATIKHFVGAKLNNYVIPIPPVEEQHRIVAKVNELIILCNQLKTRLTEAQTTQLHLADAITEQAIN